MKTAIRLAVALTVSGVLLFLAFRKVDFPAMVDVIRSVDPWMVLVFFVLHTALQAFRILRWNILIEPFAKISTKSLFRIGGIGMMLILLLPLRLGELARPYLLKKESGAPMSSGLGSVVIERAIDGLLVTFLFFFTTTLLGEQYAIPTALQSAAYVALAVFASATLVSVGALLSHGWVPDLIERIGKPIAPGLTERAVGMLRAFVEGLRALPSVKAISLFVLWTLAYWVANGLGMWALALGFGWDLPLISGFLLVAILVIGIMVPAGPGFLGPYQVALVWGLSIFGVSATESAAYAMVCYPLTVLSVLSFGLPWLFAGRARVGDIVRQAQAEQS